MLIRTVAYVGACIFAMPFAGEQRLEGQQTVRQRIGAAPDGSVKIFNMVGGTRVIGWDRDTVVVTGTVASGARWYHAATGRDTKVGIDAPDSVSEGSFLEVRVPTGSRVWVKSLSADIEISGVSGGLDLNSVSGRIRAEGTPRQVHAESLDGNIEVTGAAPWTRIKTASGAITLREVKDEVTATSVSGAINIGAGRITRGRFESVSGDILVKSEPDPAGSLSVESHSGSIELQLPAKVAADIEITTFGPEIVSEFKHPPAQPGASRGHTLSFSIGAGGADISVRSFKGSVVLRKR